MRWLPVYNVGLAVVAAASVAAALHDRGAAARAGHWTAVAEARREAVLHERARDQEAVARYATLAGAYTDLVARVQRHQRELAAEIDATRKLRRPIVTGSTVVVYVGARGR